MKISIVLKLLLYCHAIAISQSKITNCSYINNRTDSVEINCNIIRSVRRPAPAPYKSPVIYEPAYLSSKNPIYARDSFEPVDRSVPFPRYAPAPPVSYNPGYPSSKEIIYVGDSFEPEMPLEEIHEVAMQIPDSVCCNDLFKSDSKEKNRQNVKLLKASVTCDFIGKLSKLFENINELDISSSSEKTSTGYITDLKNLKHLSKFNASQNNLTTLFGDLPNSFEIDLSFNNLRKIFDYSYENVTLSIFNMSHNVLRQIHEYSFIKMTELKVLDLSHNEIRYIFGNTFQNNVKLEVLKLDNNPLSMLNCHWFSIKGLASVTITLARIDTMLLDCMGCSIGVASDNTTEIVIGLTGVKNKLRFNKVNMTNLTHLSMVTNEMENTSKIIELLPTSLLSLDLSSSKGLNISVLNKFNNLTSLDLSNTDLRMFNTTALFVPFKNLQTLSISNAHLENIQDFLQLVTPSAIQLDLSFNYLGKLNATTFQQFTNLINLNLSHTNLSNFGFSTFYHQINLRTLDLSYNNLMRVDFHLFVRNFRYLSALHLEGNNLTDISTINPTVFPSLTTLAISKNQLSCHNLASFLHQWKHLYLDIENPTAGQTHIDGIKCSEGVDPNSIEETTKAMAIMDGIHTSKCEVFVTHTESNVTKYLLLLLCVMCFGYLLIKSKLIQRIKGKLTNNLPVNNSIGKPSTSAFVLMEQEYL